MKNHYNKIAGRDTARTIAISDGVIAVALTLLVLEIKAPISDSITSDAQLIEAFWELKEKFLVYLLAFMTCGIFWNGHAAQYKHIIESDRNLSWLNLLFLLTVTFLPFSTAFLGDYIQFKFSIAVYWSNIALMGLTLFIHWNYAYKNNLVDPETKDLVHAPLRERIISAQTLYFIGALLCFINPIVSVAFIILVQANYAFGWVKGISFTKNS